MSERNIQGGREVVGVEHIQGPILVVERAGTIGYDEVVEVIDSQGHSRLGRVPAQGSIRSVVLRRRTTDDGLKTRGGLMSGRMFVMWPLASAFVVTVLALGDWISEVRTARRAR